MQRLEALAALTSDPPRLTRVFLSEEHRRANELVLGWLGEAGMRGRVDAMGNVTGRVEGKARGLPALMLGSHLDTVRDAGRRYDGMLEVSSPRSKMRASHRCRAAAVRTGSGGLR